MSTLGLCGQIITEHAVNHISGGITGAINSELKPGGPSFTDVTSGGLQGFFSGAVGPSVAR